MSTHFCRLSFFRGRLPPTKLRWHVKDWSKAPHRLPLSWVSLGLSFSSFISVPLRFWGCREPPWLGGSHFPDFAVIKYVTPLSPMLSFTVSEEQWRLSQGFLRSYILKKNPTLYQLFGRWLNKFYIMNNILCSVSMGGKSLCVFQNAPVLNVCSLYSGALGLALAN